jgi:FG-GAP-like repeat
MSLVVNFSYQRLSPGFLGLSLAVALAAVVCAQEALLRPGQSVYAGPAPLAPGSYAIPCVADWNGDGRKDLIVGYQTAGKVALFLNSGTDANPVFTSYANLQAGGVDIYLPSSGCGAPAPWVCDYDHDGKRDLLVGSGADGCVYFYRNTSTDAAPVLAPGVKLMVGGSPLSVTYRATPYVYDWDGDGLDDLLCGNGDGYVYFFKNIGTAQAPAYAAGTRVQAGDAYLNLGIRSVVRVFDWDGDGVNDLVGSSDTGVYWCRNIGTKASPVLLAPVALRVPVTSGSSAPIYTGPRMRLDLMDWNGDGVIDILLGNANGTLTYYEGYRFAFKSISPPSAGRCAVQWNSAPYLKYHVFAGTSPGLLTGLVASNFPSAGKTTCWTSPPSVGSQFYRLQVAP